MKTLQKYAFLLLAVLLLAFGIISEEFALQKDHELPLEKKFEKVFLERLSTLENTMDEISETLESPEFSGNLQNHFNKLFPAYKQEGLGFLISRGDELLFWSSNHFSFSGILDQEQAGKLLFLPNGVFFLEKRQADAYTIYGLIHIKNNYAIENEFIRNNFDPGYGMPENYAVKPAESPTGASVHDRNGKFLFSLVPQNNTTIRASSLILPASFYLLALLCFLIFARQMFKSFRHEHFILRVFILGLVLFALYWVRILFHFPGICKQFSLFGPSLYAYSSWLPSLGDLLLFSILLFFWSFNFAKDFTLSRSRKKWELTAAFTFILIFYLTINFLIENLIRNSSFTFQLNRIDDVNKYSLIGYSIIALLFFSAFIINLQVVEYSERIIRRKLFFYTHLLLIIICGTLCIYLKQTEIYIITLYLITNLSVFVLQKTQLKRFSLSFIIYFVSLYTFFSLIIIQSHNNARRQQTQRLMAITQYSEHDPAAEVFLKEIQQQFSVDTVIPPLLLGNAYQQLEDYISRNYFNGYFKKYDAWITVCDGNDSLLVQPDDQLVPCYPFFEQMIEESGTEIPGTSFYYMNNMDGRISYFGRFTLPLPSKPLGQSIFIELKSKLLPEGVGFPELLLDKSLQEPSRYRNFSYAKYYKNELVYLSGDYQYNYYISTYNIGNSSKELSQRSWDGYDHLIYNLGNDNYIIVSTKSFGFGQYLISFPYLFVFYFVFILLIVLIGNAKYRNQALVYDLKFRIQISIIAIVLFSLLLVASGTIYYNLREYKNKHQHDLNEKMKSIAEEINLRLKNVDQFTPDVLDWLWQDLGELSNIFRTDINIYSFNGELIASSRPEVFNRGIISARMDAQAFYELTENYQISITQPEKIGNLSYLSIYEPIINNRGEYLGFINLPYFTRGDELRQEVTTFIVAFINLYVLLFFISVVVALLLANQITRPLTLIRERLKGMQLDKQNEQISYNADDEIGALVKEYNRKVEELSNSAELLARTQREMAWREMAKQIAHEIKNPLTPMKLHIQHLQRAKSSNSEQYDEIFNRVTRTLIEQIDTLSGIATEFSNFAKMPNAKNEVFNLAERLKQVTELFDSSKTMQIKLLDCKPSTVMIKGDKEQLSRAIINLIKNGIQSIPTGEQGLVELALSCNETQAIIQVKDNGAGIPEDIRGRLFQPNFTTKSSGMGLGLAIVKKIVESANGRIWFESELNQGTTFYVELPLYTESS
ncbi:HAMP domain-containing sensor histidine kinase [Mangrovibacterium marinum]|uniref:histidine kinase n=1 Tax=Mangrovibacterium marinum TaxID=1639118 RepID=A0A2T5C610_9BACT|nr:HAMP domain-containing sensor histidine kinase [Mangrovibacterium marinum]PTN10394.1 phospho-acceptor domain-containing protein [Mangrovibacterium marinum]